MDKEKALSHIKSYVDIIREGYSEHTRSWNESLESKHIKMPNLKSSRLDRDLSPEFQNLITAYLGHLRNVDLARYTDYSDGMECYCRIKNRSSVSDKVNTYLVGPEKGKIPVKKCLNDLFGARIVLDADLSFGDVCSMFTDSKDLKCLDSSKPPDGEPKIYVATHLYFQGMGNCSFPWELQIWSKKHSQMNMNSHEEHRNRYQDWAKVE